MMRVIRPGSARTVSFQPLSRRRGGNRRPGETDRPLVLKFKCVKRPAVEYLKPDQVKVDGVRIFRQIDQLPNFRRVEHRLLSYGHVPGSVVQQHAHGLLHQVHSLIESETARLDRAGFQEFLKTTAEPEEEKKRPAPPWPRPGIA